MVVGIPGGNIHAHTIAYLEMLQHSDLGKWKSFIPRSFLKKWQKPPGGGHSYWEQHPNYIYAKKHMYTYKHVCMHV